MVQFLNRYIEDLWSITTTTIMLDIRWILFILALGYILLQKTGNRRFVLGLIPVAVIFLVVLNPVYYLGIYKVMDYSTYRRLWLLPRDLITAYGIICFGNEIRRGWKRLLYVGIILIVLLNSGSLRHPRYSGGSGSAYTYITKWYSLDKNRDDCKEIIEAILADDNYSEKKVSANYQIIERLRQCSAECEYYNSLNGQCHYLVVFSKDDERYNRDKQGKYELLKRTGEYCVYYIN